MNDSKLVKTILQQPDKKKALTALNRVNLTKNEHQVIEKIYMEGLTAENVAESMDVSVSAVNKWKKKAIDKCTAVFKKETGR